MTSPHDWRGKTAMEWHGAYEEVRKDYANAIAELEAQHRELARKPQRIEIVHIIPCMGTRDPRL